MNSLQENGIPRNVSSDNSGRGLAMISVTTREEFWVQCARLSMHSLEDLNDAAKKLKSRKDA